jgi:hypothetical protein
MSYWQCRWVEYIDCFDAPIEAVEGKRNKVADALSRYYVNNRPDEVHAAAKYVQADLKLDKDMDDLPRNRVEEIRLSAMQTRSNELREQEEKRHEEAAELAPEQEAVPAAANAKDFAEDPTAYQSAAHAPLQPRVEGADGFLHAVRASYEKDKLFGKILAKPSEYAAFLIKNKLIYTKTRIGAQVLCIPSGTLQSKNLRQIVIETAHQTLGHFGPQKMSDYVRRFYWWATMRDDIKAFCASCHKCRTTKPSTQKPAGLLHSLPVPDRPWGSISMDFLGPFPKSEGYDYLWVIVCRLTGMVHLIPCTTKTHASELAYIFLKEVVRLHGVPDSIVSDCDSKFTSHFWRELHRVLGSKLLMSTAFHLQTDGATERANRSVLQVLRTLVQPDQLNWVAQLPLAEFAINSCINASTGYAPFELNAGFMPRSMNNFAIKDSSPGVQDFAAKARENLEHAHDAIIASRVRQTHQANKKRSLEPEFKEGQMVYLSTENITMPKKRARKLTPRFVGPFKIIEAYPESSTYKIELPDVLLNRGIHPRFHASLLREYIANDDKRFPDRKPSEWYDFGEANVNEQWVDSIVAHTKSGTRVGDLQFIVRWADGDVTYEPYEHVKNLMQLDRYFELMGVTKWSQLPKTRAQGLPEPDMKNMKQSDETRGVERAQDNLQATSPVEPKIIWKITREGIKTQVRP